MKYDTMELKTFNSLYTDPISNWSLSSNSSVSSEALSDLRRSIDDLRIDIQTLNANLEVLGQRQQPVIAGRQPALTWYGNIARYCITPSSTNVTSTNWDILEWYDLLLLAAVFVCSFAIALMAGNGFLDLQENESVATFILICVGFSIYGCVDGCRRLMRYMRKLRMQ